MRVAVLGSSGGMGGYFSRYFLAKGAEVRGFDPRPGRIRNRNFTPVSSGAEAADGADVVLVATPMESTIEALGDAIGALPRGATVVEMTSVKGGTLQVLKDITAASGAKLLSIHPLFGPSQRARRRMRLCVIRTGPWSVRRARSLFPEAVLIPMEAGEHDRMMAVTLSLTHLLNIAYAGAAGRYLSPKEFRRVQTPTSALQLTLAEGVLSQSPSLVASIQLANRSSVELADVLIGELSFLRGLLERGNRDRLEEHFKKLSRAYAADSKSALGRVYRAFETSTP